MKYLNIDLDASCFPFKQFPEFYPDHIYKVLSQLNRHLERSLHEPLPDGATVGSALDCLRDDLRNAPGLYLSTKLWGEIYCNRDSDSDSAD